MFTGQYPNRHGLVTYRNKLDPRSPHLAEVLRDAGFQTAAIVSASNVGRDYGFDRGFDSFVQLPELDPVESTGVTDEAIAWLGQRDVTRPFFLFLHLFDLHNPYGAKPGYESELVEPYEGTFTGDTLELIAVTRGEREMSARDLAHIVQLYDAGIRQVDDEIARLRSALETRGLFDRTLIITTSDHGEEFRDHGGFLHAYSHYQELLHVPLFLRGPGLPPATRISEPVSLVDLMPTLLAYLGIELPREQQGADLRGLWGDAAAPSLPARTLFSEADQTNRKPNIRRSARHGRHKLLYNLRTRKIELYDLGSDPQEQRNLAESQPALRRRLLTDLNEFIQGAEARGQVRDVTDQQLEELRRLGYIQDAPAAEVDEDGARDRDR
jgi:arylsulfatase A-like enzyme